MLEAHSHKQDRAIMSDKPIVSLFTGIQFGKTTAGGIKTRHKLIEHGKDGNNFLILAPTYKILQQSTLPAFMAICGDLGEYNKVDAAFRLYAGGTAYFRTGTDPNSIVGITNVMFIWGDEAGLYSLYFWENIQARAAIRKAQIMLTSSPYALNWAYKELVRHPERDDLELIQARSDENPYFPKDEYERKRVTMEPRRFSMMFGGDFNKMVGLVYDCFEEHVHVVSPFTLPSGTRFYGGIDWGYTHPFSLVVRAVTPNGFHYQVSEFYRSNMTITDIVKMLKQKKIIWGIERFYCGPDQPGYIEELNRNSLPAIAANNDVKLGVGKHYELIKSNRYFIFSESSPHSIDEYLAYHWPSGSDVEPDKDLKDKNPVKQNDDAMDANRYVTMGTVSMSQEKRQPGVGQQDVHIDRLTNEQRIAKLKKGKRSSSEVWS